MKKIIDFYKSYKIYKKNIKIFNIIDNLFKFIQKTHEEQKPMTTNLGFVNVNDGKEYGDVVNIWASIGEGNPIERLSALKAQNETLKDIIRKYKRGLEVSDLEIEQILKHFN